jgi:hypothetical protein
MPDPTPETQADPLEDAVIRLAIVRARQAKDKAVLDEAKRQFALAHEGLAGRLAAHAALIAETEETVRAVALARFKTDGDRNPTEGVTVVGKVTYEYDPDEAKKWAVVGQHGGCLNLDKAEFKAIAGTALRPEFVTVKDGHQVRIAKDLSHAIPQEAPHAES